MNEVHNEVRSDEQVDGIPLPSSLRRTPRLLFLTHRFPYPPNRGDRIRSYNMLRVLAETFEVTLACPHDETVSADQLQHVQQFCTAIHTHPTGKARWVRAGASAISGRSLTEGLFTSRALQQSILQEHAQQPFDAVLVFCSSMYPYVAHSAFRGSRVVVDLVDVDSMKWEQLANEAMLLKRPIYALEARRVRVLEQRIAENVGAIALVSDNEAAAFRSRVTSQSPIIGVSNGVNTDYFRPRSVAATDTSEGRKPTGELRVVKTSHSSSDCNQSQTACRLVFTGVLDYTPNVEGMRWFCERILPGLRKVRDFQLDIVGRRANAAVQKLASIDGVNLVGEVPDVRPYLHVADVAISPLKLARGIQNKVLEAMACRLPVIATTQSAEGIDATDGQELLIADTEDQWHTALLRLANDPEERQQFGTAARALVVNHYSWKSKLQQLEELLNAKQSTTASRS